MPRREQYKWPSGQIYAEAHMTMHICQTHLSAPNAIFYRKKPQSQPQQASPATPSRGTSSLRLGPSGTCLRSHGSSGLDLSERPSGLHCRGVNSINGRQAKYTQKPGLPRRGVINGRQAKYRRSRACRGVRNKWPPGQIPISVNLLILSVIHVHDSLRT